jgi:transposase-like protein
MKSTIKSKDEKEAIVAEYLLGGGTYRFLGQKHNVDFRVLHSWVMKFKGKKKLKEKVEHLVSKPSSTDEPPLPADVRVLQEELRKARLHNELLNTIIDIAEKDIKVDIRKKSGAKL